jgi:hypothetical protein
MSIHSLDCRASGPCSLWCKYLQRLCILFECVLIPADGSLNSKFLRFRPHHVLPKRAIRMSYLFLASIWRQKSSWLVFTVQTIILFHPPPPPATSSPARALPRRYQCAEHAVEHHPHSAALGPPVTLGVSEPRACHRAIAPPGGILTRT